MNPKENTRGGTYRLDIDGELPMTTLIESRLRTLGLTKAQLARRMGYETTVEKGVRRLEALLVGDLGEARHLASKLAQGLSVNEAVVQGAIEDSHYVRWARDDRAYRETFQPHVVWETVSSIPSPISAAGMVNARRGLFWYPGPNKLACINEEAVAVMPEGVACYGRVVGFRVNYTPDCAVRFNTQGDPLEALGRAVRPGIVSTLVRGRPINLADAT